MRYFLIIFLVTFSIKTNAQNTQYYLFDSIPIQEIDSVDKHIIDSCFTVYYSNTTDTNKANALAYITNAIQYDKWYLFLFSEKNGLNTLLKNQTDEVTISFLNQKRAQCYYNIGFFYYGYESAPYYNQDSAFHYLFSSLALYEQLNDLKGQRGVSNNIGSYYEKQGDIPKALEYYYRCLKIDEETGDSLGMANSYNILGSVAKNENELEKALDFYFKSLTISEAVKHKYYIASSLNNIANVYLIQFEKDTLLKDDTTLLVKAFDNYTKSLSLFQEINNKYGVAAITYKLGTLALTKKDYKTAISLFESSLEKFRPMNNKLSLSMVLERLAKAELSINRLESAEINAKQSLAIAQQIDYPTYIQNAAETLSEIYVLKGEGLKALESFKLYIENRDKVYNEQSLKAKIVESTKYEYEKQKAIDDLRNEKLIAIEKEEKEKQQLIAYGSTTGVVLSFFLVFVLIKSNRRKQRDNQVILQQKKEVSLQRDLAKANEKIAEEKKVEVEERNREIMDSITYARRLQEAVLPPQKLVKEWLTNSFILYKPKDIVSGDFYWMETANYMQDGKQHTMVFFAAADCTGHGVPGAMVSVICAGALNRAVNEFQLTDVGEILNKVTSLVIDTFKKGNDKVKDGMDIALCGLDIGRKILYTSGANNPIWIISKNKKLITEMAYNTFQHEDELPLYLHEFKSLKKPIGLNDIEEPFTTNVIQLEPEDGIYVFSDGYPDQFGGEKGKKFKYNNFRKLLLENFHLSMDEQKITINDCFENWKGEHEQIDDVCVIGVKINGKERNNFTNREIEVLEYLILGLPSKLIADKMNISNHTVDTYRRRLLAKTNTFNSTELINYCKAKEII